MLQGKMIWPWIRDVRNGWHTRLTRQTTEHVRSKWLVSNLYFLASCTLHIVGAPVYVFSQLMYLLWKEEHLNVRVQGAIGLHIRQIKTKFCLSFGFGVLLCKKKVSKFSNIFKNVSIRKGITWFQVIVNFFQQDLF